ncbi:hypothetical protein [Neobacillus sp. DY30]|uniref:hypothetical protein n=1 Tax=Neobacillus sp. DY30 TaxID=3047871 RepID=UPI0024C08AC0|nr:hypothetical protein [Neobacillus sp. DY30]WHX97955.1 hypothetical protein QNH29_14810 [Neobacillus sp. DY30]
MAIIPGKWSRIVELIELARTITSDIDEKEIVELIKSGQEEPLSNAETIRLLTSTIESLRKGTLVRGDKSGSDSLCGDINEIVKEMISIRQNLTFGRINMTNNADEKMITLQERNGIHVQPVFPSPWFHEKEVPMFGGFVRTRDIKLWENNDRLDIHIHQFKNLNGREPDDQELLDIMLSKMPLPGVTEKDEFKIMDLARSIANNGVRRPPIIDLDGTLLDGNRRVTSCYYILNSKEFTSEQKSRVEYIYVWQLTPHATDDDRRRVVVSMNFEKDHKIDWPEYVKASKIYEDWQAMLALEPYAGSRRQNEIKRELSLQYALGPDARYVSRYIRMFEEAEEFEIFHIEDRERDEYEVKHKSSEYFQYFDELTKGSVRSTLDQDEVFRNLVYDLLFQDKFTNWKQIRDLPKIANNEDARKLLREARAEGDVEEAQDKVVSACSVVQVAGKEARTVGANERIKNFTDFLLQLPIGAFTDGTIKRESLNNLKEALQHVNVIIQDIEGRKEQIFMDEEDDELAV